MKNLSPMFDNTFKRLPIRVECDIPIFSERDEYIANYDKIADDHLESIATTGRSPFMVGEQIEDSDAATLTLLRRHVPDGSRVLDVGVGTGILLGKTPNYDRHGVDISISYLKVAKRQGIKAVMSKLSELPYLDRHFDGVIACDVLEHLLDLDASVTQLARILKPGGVLVVRVPNAEDLSSYLDEQLYQFVHVRSFTYSSLRLYFEKCFKFSYVEKAYAAKSFYTATQLLHPAPKFNSSLRTLLPRLAASTSAVGAPCGVALECLCQGLLLSYEAQIDALILLRDKHPAIFKELAEFMVRPAEIVCVFRAPTA